MIQRKLDRAAWNALSKELKGSERLDNPHVSASLSGDTIEFEYESGRSQGSVSYTPGATDVRVGDVQMLVSRDRVVLLTHRGYGDDARWWVLADEELGVER